MLQRVQTLFLLAASILIFILFFAKMSFLNNEVIKYVDINPFLVILLISFLLSFLSIFLYRKRVVQIRISLLNTLILLGFQGWILYLFFNREVGEIFSTTALFPAVAAILTFTAIRYIARDEAMVRSTSRLR